MRRLSGLVVILIAVSAFVILAARWIGSFQALPPLAAVLFTRADGQECQIPCIVGVHPDQPDMFAALKTHPILGKIDSYARGNDLQKVTGYETDFLRIQASEYEQWISLALLPVQSSGSTGESPMPRGTVYLADLVAVFGAPDYTEIGYVSFAPEWETRVIFLKSQYIAFATAYSSGNRLNPRSRLSYLLIAPIGDNVSVFSSFQHWAGFASVDRYEAQ
jgi:hypothetical protein